LQARQQTITQQSPKTNYRKEKNQTQVVLTVSASLRCMILLPYLKATAYWPRQTQQCTTMTSCLRLVISTHLAGYLPAPLLAR
jgi:hypothetical protein